MPELSERIRHLVESSETPVSIHDVTAIVERRSVTRSASGRRRSAFLVIGASVATLLLVLGLQFIPGTAQQPATAAAAVLSREAAVAANGPTNPVPGPGEYLYYRTTQGAIEDSGAPVGKQHFLFVSTETIETWVAPNGSGRQRIEVATPHLLNPADEGAWEAAGSPHAAVQPPGISDARFPSSNAVGGPTYAGADGERYLAYPASSQIPTNPAVLRNYLSRYDNGSGPSTTFLIAGEFLQEGASPALRSALFQVIEDLPGVQLLGPVSDESGRPGSGVALESGTGVRYVLVVNTSTSAVLGLKAMAGPSYSIGGTQVPEGTVVDFTNFGSTGVTSSTSVVPKSEPAVTNPE